MDARFGGSHRLGERRRRRLAVESDDAPSLAAAPAALPAPDGVSRVVHAAPQAGASEVAALPLGGLVPSAWWAYAAGGLAAMLVGAGIVIGGWSQPIGSTALTGLPRLVAWPDAPVARWYSALLLTLSSQLSLLIWWGRSRSLKDFQGRYRIWKRAAAVWLFFSFCAATGGHRALIESLLAYVPADWERLDAAAWLIPATVVGLTLLATLNREMAECRVSRLALFLSAASYFVAGTAHLRFGLPLTAARLHLLMAGSSMIGHMSLFLSMWLHARHVLHFTHDPSRAPRRRLTIPRPHFRLPKWRRASEPEASQPPVLPGPVVETASRNRAPEVEQVTAAAGTNAVERAAPPKTEPPRPKLRIDARHKPPAPASMPATPAETPIEEIPKSVTIPRAEPPSHAGQGVSQPPKASAHVVIDEEPLTLSPRSEPQPTDGKPEESAPPPQMTQDDEGPPESDATEDGWTEPFPKPDMRGMSKKQRRRLMAELREKERRGRG